VSDNDVSFGGSGSEHFALDTAVIPLGERALRNILDYVNAVGDKAETTYLEVKGALDMTSKEATAKIAKFLLGVANRRPHEAAKHFLGYAVLVIGALRDGVQGVPSGMEAHELEDRLSAYLGPQFPAFEFGRIRVDDENEVLFIIAQPPQDGQTIFPCHKNFQGADRRDNLEDGGIYVRGPSNTRPARYGEVLALVERSRGGRKPLIKLEVEVLGPICRVDNVDAVLESLRNYEEKQFGNQPDSAQDNFTSVSYRLALSAMGSSGPLSAEERAETLAGWRNAKAQHISEGREHFLGAALRGAGIRIVSHDRFVARPHLVVTFHGCELLDHVDPDDADYELAVVPVVRSQRTFLQTVSSSLPLAPRGYPVTWRNREQNAEVVLTPESFRPNTPWVSDKDDYVLVARDARSDSVHVTWLLTEEGSDAVTTGELRVPTADLIDAADLFEMTFLQD
jgi:hypothetical protein